MQYNKYAFALILLASSAFASSSPVTADELAPKVKDILNGKKKLSELEESAVAGLNLSEKQKEALGNIVDLSADDAVLNALKEVEKAEAEEKERIEQEKEKEKERVKQEQEKLLQANVDKIYEIAKTGKISEFQQADYNNLLNADQFAKIALYEKNANIPLERSLLESFIKDGGDLDIPKSSEELAEEALTKKLSDIMLKLKDGKVTGDGNNAETFKDLLSDKEFQEITKYEATGKKLTGEQLKTFLGKSVLPEDKDSELTEDEKKAADAAADAAKAGDDAKPADADAAKKAADADAAKKAADADAAKKAELEAGKKEALVASIKAALKDNQNFSELTDAEIKTLNLTKEQIEALKTAKATNTSDIADILNKIVTVNTTPDSVNGTGISSDITEETPFYQNKLFIGAVVVLALASIGGGVYMMTSKSEETDL